MIGVYITCAGFVGSFAVGGLVGWVNGAIYGMEKGMGVRKAARREAQR